MGTNDSRLRRIYHNMKSRCNNTSFDCYNSYGGRGIKICSAWENSFKAFESWALENGYDDELTLERIDNNKNYEPNNCRWATRKEQANNRRTTHLLTIKGESKSLQVWAEQNNLNPNTVLRRINSGWDVKDAVTTSVNNKFNTKRLYAFQGEMLPIKRISKLTNTNDTLPRRYLNYGYTIDEALKKCHYGEQYKKFL